jgi:acyl-coenzyme A synthetase/AMP-(fatty) acid ligase
MNLAVAPFRIDADLFAARGDRCALFGKTDSITYRVLGERACVIADSLDKLGVVLGEPVGLLSSGRAFDEAVGLVGIMLRGAVVVPLDASAPPARWASIAQARGIRVFVHDEPARSLVDKALAFTNKAFGRVCLGATGNVVDTSPSDTSVAEGVLDPAVACVLHTSGTTGGPKPVTITWAGLDAFTSFMIDLVGLSENDRVLRVAELVFDLSWFDHLATWRAGATLCTMSRRDLATGNALKAVTKALEPTVIYGVPSMFMKLGAACTDGELHPAPRAILFAGEVFPPRELATFAALVPASRLWNLYGPTETNVCTYHEVDRDKLDGRAETPIGLACPYALCWLVEEGDPSRQIDGFGVGELVVEGPTTIGGGPYATGDRVERKADGLLYFRGRLDRMIKIRGYRVEPGEVEATLEKHAAVRQSAVITHNDERLGKTLWAFVTLREGTGEVDERSLRIFLADVLPAYMVPERIVCLDELPRTVTGKTDYRVLEGMG